MLVAKIARLEKKFTTGDIGKAQHNPCCTKLLMSVLKKNLTLEELLLFKLLNNPEGSTGSAIIMFCCLKTSN